MKDGGGAVEMEEAGGDISELVPKATIQDRVVLTPASSRKPATIQGHKMLV
jgi:hypothetical protein